MDSCDETKVCLGLGHISGQLMDWALGIRCLIGSGLLAVRVYIIEMANNV